MLRTITITGHAAGPHLLVIAGVHGDEWEPMAAVRHLADRIDPAQLIGRVTLIPMANEPAFRLGQRVGEDGLDLARVCPGDAAGSTTLRIAAELSKQIESADAMIDLHTGGRLYDILPLAGYMLHPHPTILDAQRRMASAMNLPLVWGTSASLNGRTLSVARDASIPAIYCEAGGPGFRPGAVQAYMEGCLNVMSELGMLSRPAAPSQVKWTLEDTADQSGHLQVQHQAERDGFFEPTATLGQQVIAGQPVGRIHDVPGKTGCPVLAAQSGVLLLLRAVCSVRKGDALAAIAAVR